MEKKIFYNDKKNGIFEITFNYDILNIHIKDSRKLYYQEDVEKALEFIHNTPEYEELVAAGYTRSPQSQVEEWRAHNIMWSWGYKRNRTGSVDLDQNETPLRKLLYKIISYLG